jgi:hypothetical protein
MRRTAQRGRFSCAELERRLPVEGEPEEEARTSLVASMTSATSCLTVAKAVVETETLVVAEEEVSPKEQSCRAKESIPQTFSTVRY